MRTLRPFALAALLCAAACSRDDAAKGRDPSGSAAAADLPFAAVTAEGLLAKVRGMNAKAVVVNAWASWCDSCEHELPMLQRVAERLAPRGVRVVLVSVDEPADREKAQALLAKSSVALASYWAAPPLEPFKAGLNPRWPGMLPATFLFDGAGKLRYFWGGEVYEKELLPVVEGLLAGKLIDGESRFDLAPGQTTPR